MTAVRPVWSGMSVVVQLVMVISYNRLNGADAPFDGTLYGTRAPFCPFPRWCDLAQPERPLRADAARNRARVLEVAYDIFAAEGLSVPIDEIARRAGVGAGTVYRHFPTKEDLFRAVVEDRSRRIVDDGRALLDTGEPGEALFTFLRSMVLQWGATDRGLADALAGIGIDIKAAMPEAEERVPGHAGRAVGGRAERRDRAADIDLGDVEAILVGAQAMQATNPDAAERLTEVVLDGLRAR